jgi:hypothetical protein
MCWDMGIEHCNDHCLADTDYFLRVGADLCYDLLLQDYIQQVAALRRCSPAPMEIPIGPKHQPYFCGLQVNAPKEHLPPLPATQPTPIPTDHPMAAVTCDFQHLSNWLISFGIIKPSRYSNQTSYLCLYNSEVTRTASMLAHFDWAVYGFNRGHFCFRQGPQACWPILIGQFMASTAGILFPQSLIVVCLFALS